MAARPDQWRWLIIDEITMVSAKLLAEVDVKLRSKSYMMPVSGTSNVRPRRQIWSMMMLSGERPHTGKRLETSQNCFHVLML